MANVRQVISRLPKPTMDNEEQREGPRPAGKPKLNELIGILTVPDPFVETR
jgi:hypothetical protein